MTKEEFKAKAKEIIDNEQFGSDGVLFDYEDISQIKVAQVDHWGELDVDMLFMNFIDELYEQIKGDLEMTYEEIFKQFKTKAFYESQDILGLDMVDTYMITDYLAELMGVENDIR